MGKFIDLTGQKFEKLLVIKNSNLKSNNGDVLWECACDCGKTEVLASSRSLTLGRKKSCGCLRKEWRNNSKFLDLTGQRFGMLLVLEKTEKPNNIKVDCGFYLCQCDCGKARIFSTTTLISGRLSSCGCSLENPYVECRLDLTNQKFGRLLVIKKIGSGKAGNPLWLCKCDCGRDVNATTGRLRSGHTQSCGCLKIDLDCTSILSEEDSFFNSYLGKYKTEAKNRSLEFNLTKEEFINLVTQNCHYCGRKPEKRDNLNINRRTSIPVNGVDRKNSDLNYEISNCVPCCTRCNRGKLDVPYDEFIEWIKRIHFTLIESKAIL
jgi:hypothetical protein